MIEITKHEGPLVEMRVSDTLKKEDYERIMPTLEQAAAGSDMRTLIKLDDFKGFTGPGLLEELKFDFKHRSDFEKIAVVGEGRWQERATKITAPLFSGEARFFESMQDARAWVQSA